MTISVHPPEFARKTPSAKEVLFVPCRITALGVDVLVTGHLPDGTPTAIAFTSHEGVARAMGTSQPWIRLSARGLRSMLGPRGITHLQVDPDLVAPNPAPTSRFAAASPWPCGQSVATGSRNIPVLNGDRNPVRLG